MPRMSDTISVPANSTTTNQLANLQYQYIPFRRAGVRLGLSASATGMKATFQIGERNIVPQGRIPATNRDPDFTTSDLITTALAFQSQQLILTFTNTTAGALTVNWSVDVEPA